MTIANTLPAPLTVEPAEGGRLVLSYERVSRFRAANVDATVTRGVHRQASDAEDMAGAKGLGPVTHLNGDEGITASRFGTKERQDWKRLLTMVRAGDVSHVLVWILDRIIRQTRDLDDLLEACRIGGAVIVQTASGTTIHPDDPDSVAMAKIAGVLAETEVAKMSKRQIRKHRTLAQEGKPHGGRRVFGYTSATLAEVDEAEAAAVREVVARVLQGESLASCARWLNSQGLPGTTGSAWTGPNLGTYLRRPTLAARRVYHRQDVGEGDWPALITYADHRALLVHLNQPDRRTSPTPGRRHLLTGLAVCGVCGATIRGTAGESESLGQVYRCQEAGCYGVQRSLAEVDRMTEAWVVERLSRMDASGALADDTAAVELATLTRAAKALAGRRAETIAYQTATGAYSPADYAETLAGFTAEAARLDTAITAVETTMARPEAALEDVTGPDPALVWDSLSLARKRAIIKVLCTVTIERAARKGARFSRDSVTIRPVR